MILTAGEVHVLVKRFFRKSVSTFSKFDFTSGLASRSNDDVDDTLHFEKAFE